MRLPVRKQHAVTKRNDCSAGVFVRVQLFVEMSDSAKNGARTAGTGTAAEGSGVCDHLVGSILNDACLQRVGLPALVVVAEDADVGGGACVFATAGCAAADTGQDF